MKRSSTFVFLVLTLLLLLPLAVGQDSANIIEPMESEMVNEEANISFPPPVYVLRDNVDIRGTVTLAGMRNFFVEYRQLFPDMMMEEECEVASDWLPATLPRIAPVTDDILGTWNLATLRLCDGIYELRLKINTDAEEPSYFRVSPIRIENNPPAFVAEQQVMEVIEPTAMPEPTAIPDTSPRVTALVNSNVRAGDSTLYRIIGGLHEGNTAQIKGISSFGTGWFYIELEGGQRGFIHPNIVSAEGDLSNLPRINPPPLPPTPIPQPTAIPVPSSGANLRITHVQISPHPAICNQAYEIQVTVINDGNAATPRGSLVEVRDNRHDGAGRVTTGIGITPLAAGETRTFSGHLTQNQYFEELHHINLIADVNNEVAETNENDNRYATAPYILQKGSCG